MRRLPRELKQVKRSVRRSHHYWELDVNPIDIANSSSHEDYDEEDKEVRRKRHPRDYLRDFKVEVLEFDGKLNPKSYLDVFNL